MLNIIKSKIKRAFFRHMEEYEITYDELIQMQRQGALIIDVRSSQEYREGHINRAINIPEYEISENIVKRVKNKNERIVLYCSHGERSKKAYKKLKKMGYSKVYSLYEGLESIG